MYNILKSFSLFADFGVPVSNTDAEWLDNLIKLWATHSAEPPCRSPLKRKFNKTTEQSDQVIRVTGLLLYWLLRCISMIRICLCTPDRSGIVDIIPWLAKPGPELLDIKVYSKKSKLLLYLNYYLITPLKICELSHKTHTKITSQWLVNIVMKVLFFKRWFDYHYACDIPPSYLHSDPICCTISCS